MNVEFEYIDKFDVWIATCPFCKCLIERDYHSPIVCRHYVDNNGTRVIFEPDLTKDEIKKTHIAKLLAFTPDSLSYIKLMTILANMEFQSNEEALGAVRFMGKIANTDAANIDDAIPNFKKEQ